MLNRPFWFFFVISIITAVSTQQLLSTANQKENVEKNLKWKIDTAKLTLIPTSTKHEDISINILSDICYECAYYEVAVLGKHHNNLTILVDTRWPLNIKLQTSNCSEILHEHFGEYGEYLIHINITSGCPHITDIHTQIYPINTMMPILVSFCIILSLIIIYQISMKIIQKISNRNQQQHSLEPLVVEDENTDEQQQKGGGTSFNSPPPSTSSNPSSSTSSSNRQRLKSIDTFRGLCLILMIFVNMKGGYYWFFRHSPWNGLTVADLVFPWFMFLMGVNIPLSIESLIRKKTPSSQIVYKAIRRTLILFSLGLFIINHNTSWSNMRIPGVLQRFAIAYFVAFFLQWNCHVTKDQMSNQFPNEESWSYLLRDVIIYWQHWLMVIILETIWLCITFLLPVPGCPTGYIGPGGLADHGKYNKSCVGGSAGYIDRMVFGTNHMYGHPTCKNIYYPTLTNDEKVSFDPEGILGSINGCVIVIIGCQAGKIFLYYKSAKERTTRWSFWCLLFGIISIILCKADMNSGWIPVNKNLWSTTYVTTMACMAFFLLALFYCLTDVWKIWSGKPLDFVGMNSILLYVGHEVFTDYVPFSWGITQHDTHAEWIAMNLIGVGYWILIAFYCFHIKFFLKI